MESNAITTAVMAADPTEPEVIDLGNIVTLTEGSKKKAGTEDKRYAYR
ncbi:albusnodin family lasso peptide [Promicromonospora sp. NPDC019610]